MSQYRSKDEFEQTLKEVCAILDRITPGFKEMMPENADVYEQVKAFRYEDYLIQVEIVTGSQYTEITITNVTDPCKATYYFDTPARFFRHLKSLHL